MGRIAAVFDVDRTLLPGISSEQIFLPYLVRRRKLGLRSLIYSALFGLRDPVQILRHGIAANKAYLHRRRVDEVRALAQACFAEYIRPRLSAVGLERARWHREQGHLVVLLTGSPEFLIEPLRQLVEAEYVIACRMQAREGRYRGRMVGLYPRGRNKAELMKRFAAEHEIDLAQSYAYADHYTDAALLELVGHPVAVNPGPRMRRIAQQRRWAIEHF